MDSSSAATILSVNPSIARLLTGFGGSQNTTIVCWRPVFTAATSTSMPPASTIASRTVRRMVRRVSGLAVAPASSARPSRNSAQYCPTTRRQRKRTTIESPTGTRTSSDVPRSNGKAIRPAAAATVMSPSNTAALPSSFRIELVFPVRRHARLWTKASDAHVAIMTTKYVAMIG